MKWDKWTRITIFAAFIELWVFILGISVLIPVTVEAARVANSCSDSDGGNVPFTFGAVSGYYNNKPFGYSDYCTDPGKVREYYCYGKLQRSTSVNCGADGYVGGNYCLNGNVYKDYKDYYCGSGACASTTAPTLQQACQYGCTNGVCNQMPADSCSDTDGGIITATLGTTSGYLGGSSYSHTDYCLNSVTIREYYCSGTFEQSSYQNCTNGCSNGACIQGPADSCADTDGGYAPAIQGTVSGYDNGYPYSYIDSCNSTMIINEWYCSGTNPGIYQWNCAMNYTGCVNGACV